MSFEYFLILGFFFLVALALKAKFKIKVFKSTREALVYFSIILVLGAIWDNFAIWRGHWSYPGTGITGIFIGLAPLEDYFFAVVCSFYAIVLYKTLQKKS